MFVRNCREFKGSDDPDWTSGPFRSKSAPVIKGVDEADKALKLSREERKGLVVELLPSDDENDVDEMDCKYYLSVTKIRLYGVYMVKNSYRERTEKNEDLHTDNLSLNSPFICLFTFSVIRKGMRHAP